MQTCSRGLSIGKFILLHWSIISESREEKKEGTFTDPCVPSQPTLFMNYVDMTGRYDPKPFCNRRAIMSAYPKVIEIGPAATCVSILIGNLH